MLRILGPLLLLLQELKVQLLQLRSNMKVMALVVLPFARAGTESLTAVYTRTFEKAAFGFAKVNSDTAGGAGLTARNGMLLTCTSSACQQQCPK